jgi:[ribosomal protein S5]-alanine N-acetyltransferase
MAIEPLARHVVLATAHTRLTTWIESDRDELVALHSEPATMRYMRSGVEDYGRVAHRLARYLAAQESLGWTRWRVEDEGGKLIGRAGFELAEEHGSRRRELGYLLAPTEWGRGFASEITQALVMWHRAHPEPLLDVELVAYTSPDNAASRRVLEKNGFSFTGECTIEGHPSVGYSLS